MRAPLTSDQPGTIGPYQLLGQLGRGGLGAVFLGRSANGADVAVRVIRAELAADPWFRTRFRAEVDAARTVRGAFVAPVVDADLDGDAPWLATAYVAGPSLAESVRVHGPVAGGALVVLAAGLVEGLDAIHAAGVLHGNLNPGNVLLTEDGPRMVDFGIGQAAADAGLWSPGLSSAARFPAPRFSAPGFSAPEQAMGREPGPPADIFSLGAVLFFAGAGQGPFGSGTTAELMYRLVNRPAEVGDLPREVRGLVADCLAKQPGSRPSVSRLRAELDVQSQADGALPRALPTSAAASPAFVVARPSAGEPWRRGQRRSRHRRPRPSAPVWIGGGLLTASAAVIVVLTGVIPSSPAGQARFNARAALAAPASTSQAPLIASSSRSVPSASSPAGHSGSSRSSVTPSVLAGPSASAFVSPSASASGPSSPSAPSSQSASTSPTSSASASPSASASSSPSASPSAPASSRPSPSPSPSSPRPSSPSPSPSPSASSSPSSPPPSSSPPSSPPPSSSPSASSSAPSSSGPSSSPSVSPSGSASSA